jgi:two-component system chemotaxis response regulator CheY
MFAKRILSIGQCSADHGSISRTLEQHFHAEVVSADSRDEALKLLRTDPFDLVLINRVLDRDHSSGLDVLRAIRADAGFVTIPVMLVSNYDDAQEQAVGLGALPGFGKAALGQPPMLARVRAALYHGTVTS